MVDELDREGICEVLIGATHRLCPHLQDASVGVDVERPRHLDDGVYGNAMTLSNGAFADVGWRVDFGARILVAQVYYSQAGGEIETHTFALGFEASSQVSRLT